MKNTNSNKQAKSNFPKPTAANGYNNGYGWLRAGIDYTALAKTAKAQAATAGR